MYKHRILTIPGLGNAGPLHWQSIWESEHPQIKRVIQQSWDEPVCSDWVKEIEKNAQAAEKPLILITHSLGCIALACWAGLTTRQVKGALIVAPPDTEKADFHPEATGFSPIPLKKLPFKSILVTSSNDPYISVARARSLARHWNSSFVNAGPLGHINSASDLGRWDTGKELLTELLK